MCHSWSLKSVVYAFLVTIPTSFLDRCVYRVSGSSPFLHLKRWATVCSEMPPAASQSILSAFPQLRKMCTRTRTCGSSQDTSALCRASMVLRGLREAGTDSSHTRWCSMA